MLRCVVISVQFEHNMMNGQNVVEEVKEGGKKSERRREKKKKKKITVGF